MYRYSKQDFIYSILTMLILMFTSILVRVLWSNSSEIKVITDMAIDYIFAIAWFHLVWAKPIDNISTIEHDVK